MSSTTRKSIPIANVLPVCSSNRQVCDALLTIVSKITCSLSLHLCWPHMDKAKSGVHVLRNNTVKRSHHGAVWNDQWGLALKRKRLQLLKHYIWGCKTKSLQCTLHQSPKKTSCLSTISLQPLPSHMNCCCMHWRRTDSGGLGNARFARPRSRASVIAHRRWRDCRTSKNHKTVGNSVLEAIHEIYQMKHSTSCKTSTPALPCRRT